MSNEERIFFAQKANELHIKYFNDIKYLSITVKKENVQAHIRTDSNKLYNYMIGLSLLNEMSKHESVIFIPDSRSIKVQSGNSLHDYLQTKLWLELGAITTITTTPSDSASSLNIQFADMLAGIIQGNFEDNNSNIWSEIRSNIHYQTLFF